MTEQRLRERLERTEAPDEMAAEERGWRVVHAAFEERLPLPRRRRRLRPALAAAALAVLALAVPATGADDWLRDLVRPGRDDARPALSSIPGGGRLLVRSDAGPWIVSADGSKRLLGSYDDAVWSPHGLFVAATRQRELVALDPRGRVRWSLARPTAISGARWSPSGFRIAYVTAPAAVSKVRPHVSTGASLRVVAGDGTGDRRIAAGVAAVPPAWRPGAEHVLAYADRAGRVRVVAPDTGRLLWTAAVRDRPRRLLWSGDGERLLAVADGSIRVLDASGRTLRDVAAPAGTTTGAVAFAGRGRRFAVVRRRLSARQSEIAVLQAERAVRPERRVFAGAGELTDVAWSPDDRWLLVGWPSADQWLFVRSGAPGKLIAFSGVARQFSPGASGRAASPRVAGWCCPR
ncbi:MAG TPA: WD40 repeat domain-containing protein [Thermoleophilaceae bacterium]